jgi:lysozyme family protein
MTFDEALPIILKHEGGATVTDDPRDPGGLTKYGISQRAFPTLDIRDLTEADAAAIYRRDYWDRAKCDSLPSHLRLVMFDMAVNMGVGKAVLLLQKACGVAQDGVIGPNTIRAAERLPDALARVSAERVLAYSGMRGFDVFGRGWLRRSFITALESK